MLKKVSLLTFKSALLNSDLTKNFHLKQKIPCLWIVKIL